MQNRVDWLDTGGGHIMVALLVFLVGVGLLFARIDMGKEIVVGVIPAKISAAAGLAEIGETPVSRMSYGHVIRLPQQRETFEFSRQER